ncbi:MAG: hypothetical protein IJH40_07030 [Ruminococcus sp.]|uniref:hypothetical protein n=1 Tax=Ruminococcus sp. TaxID=41978 RepID=UPI002872E2B9|nr:hypothetical protein [Ruminococcus sp.]MBQ3285378.1 hypothetical protein [Ruminococcus sp.]
MITISLSEDKRLQLKSATALYVGENDFERIRILLPAKVCENAVDGYDVQLHVSNVETKEYFKYSLDPKPAKSGFVATVNVGIDLTDQVQTLNLALYMKKGNEVGITNPVSISINEPAAEQDEILPRSVLIERIAELEAETAEKAALIENLNGQILDLTAQVETLTANKAELEAEIQTLTETVSALQSEVDALTSEKAETERQIATLDVASASIETVLQGGSIT